MIQTSRLPVTFGVPEDVAAGLAVGRYTRDLGGHIREAATGRWAYMFRESPPLHDIMTQYPASLPPLVARQMDMLGVGLRQVMGLQVLTLGVTVAGFDWINHRITALDRKLEGVLGEMRLVQRKLDRLDRRHDLALCAKLEAGLKMAAWAEQTGRREQFSTIRGTLVEAETHYRLLLRDMVASHGAYVVPHGYAAYAHQFALAGLARVRCDWIMDGPGAGHEKALEVETTFATIRREFHEPLKDYHRLLPVLLPQGREGQGRIEQARNLLYRAEERVRGYRAELDVCQKLGARVDEWAALGAEEKEPRLLLLSLILL
jgi:hypothetical protein